jgi:hypothetical protein
MAKLMNCVGVAALRAASAAPQLAGVDGLATGFGVATDGFMLSQLAAAAPPCVADFRSCCRPGAGSPNDR